MSRIDPRIAARRRAVQETHARRSLARLFVLLAILAMAAGVFWLFRSPVLSLSEVVVEGSSQADVETALASAGAAVGVPMMDLDIAAVEAAIEADPWVVSARVARDWPDEISVVVEERTPVAWVRTSAGWHWVALDGVSVGTADVPPEGEPVILAVDRSGSDFTADLGIKGMLAFVDSLRPDLAESAVVTGVAGSFEATIAGYEVRLGTGDEPEAKAAAVAAVIDQAPEPGSVITVMAPGQPAVLPPDAESAEAESGAPEDDAQGNPEEG